MLHHLKPNGGWIAGIAHAAALLLVVALAGCGGGEKSDESVSMQTQRSQPAKTLELPSPPPIPETPVVTPEPEVAFVTEPEPVTYEVAEAAYMERRYDEAAELFTQYTELQKGNPWGYYMLGLSLWKAGDDIGAERALAHAVELDPRHVKGWLNFGRVLLDTHQPNEALEKIDTAMAIDSVSSVAYRLRGRALRQLGRTSEALGAYRAAIELDPADAWSMNNLALILIEEERFAEALPPLARAIELKSDNPVFFNNLGMALEGTGRFRAAESAYQSAVDIENSYFKAGMNLERVAAVVEDPGIEPVDLEMLAQSFVDEIAGRESTVAVQDHSDALEGDAVVGPTSDDPQVAVGDVEPDLAVSEADSTGGKQDR